MRIQLPNPPSENERLAELIEIQAIRQASGLTPTQLKSLDEDVPHLFDNIIKSRYPSDKNLVEILSDAIRPIIFSQKKYYNAIRPWELARKHRIYFDHDYVESAQTPSFPSGHTAQAHFVAEMLSRKYPDLREQFHRLAREIEHSRIVLGVHFPSDNEAGRILARELARRIPV